MGNYTICFIQINAKNMGRVGYFQEETGRNKFEAGTK